MHPNGRVGHCAGMTWIKPLRSKLGSKLLISSGLPLAAALALTLPAAPAAAAPSASSTAASNLLNFREGIDLIDADPQAVKPARPEILHASLSSESWNDASDSQPTVHEIYTQLQDALYDYRHRWGSLPQTRISAGPTMRPGQSGARIALLRERLGLGEGDHFDAELGSAVRAYRSDHGLGDSALVDASTLASLNRGAEHYEKLILLNMERARALPVNSDRYILVDAAAARLWLYENGRARDSMKVVVGGVASPTPMMSTLIRAAEINPYWNVPPDLVQRLIAPRVVKEGIKYLSGQQYEVLSDWSNEAELVDPGTVDWKAVAEGRANVRVRQRPGPANAMGDIKFMIRNDFGVYLHDTPSKDLFAKEQRWLSNGCVRVEDAKRLAQWLFGETPKAISGHAGELVPLDQPVPVYITYLTAAPGSGGAVAFRSDPYGRDASAMAYMFRSSFQSAARAK